MLTEELTTQVRTYLELLEAPIELIASLDETPKSQELQELLEQISSLSQQVTLKTDGNNSRTPSFDIVRENTKVTFAGIPLGHEFTSLIMAILQVSGREPKEEPTVIEDAKNLTGEYHFETYYSLSCQNCPDVVQALNILAILNPDVTHTAIDGALNQDEVEQRDIKSVPSVYLNGELFAQGRMDLAEIIAKVDTNAASRATDRLNELDPYDVLVIGGGPAGASAAIYAARKGIRTGLLSENFGGQVSETIGIENFIGTSYTEGPKLVAQVEQHVRDYDVDIITNQRVAKIRPAGKNAYIKVNTADGAVLESKTVILATGARWRNLGVPGEEEYRNKGVTYCPHCDGPFFKGKNVAVVGGGNSGVEAAIDLAGIVKHVTVLEYGDALRADAVLQNKLNSLENVTVHTNAQTTEITGDGAEVTGINVTDRTNDTSQVIDVSGVFVQIGLLPNTEWLKGTTDLSNHGEIVIDSRGATSQPGVFAAGDCTTVPYKQIIISMGQGATAALAAFDHLIRN